MLEPAHRGQCDGPDVVLLDGDGEPITELEGPRRRTSGPAVAAGAVGAVIGAALTAVGFLVGSGEPQELPISWDTFPEKVLGLDREDLTTRATGTQLEDRFDAYFELQLENHRFAYGGEGAEVGYVAPNGDTSVRLTIVNGFVAPPLPWLPDAAQPPADLSLSNVALGDVRCAVETYYVSSESEGEMREIAAPNCVFNDEERGIGLRLHGPINAWAEPDHTAEDYAEALLAVHSWLVS